jgi:hypothetical protein
MNTQEILTLIGFAIFAMALPLFCAGIIHYIAERAKKLK